MKGLRSTLALLAVLIGLGGYIYFTGAPTSEPAKNEKVFPGLDTTKVEELKVKSASGDVTTLQKVDGAWKIVAPIETGASETDASGIVTVLGDIDVVRVVEEAPADLKEYGLDAPPLEVDFKADGGKMSGRLLIGIRTATGGNLYARRDDQPRVILVGQYHEATLNKSTFDLRDKHIVKLDRTKIDGVELNIGGKTGEFAKADNDWKMSKPFAARADNSAIDGLFGNLDALQMKSAVTAAPTADELKKFGFDKPQATVVLRAGTERTTFVVGGAMHDSSVYVRDGLRPDVYTVEASSAADFKKAIDDYRRKELFDMRAFTATRVELTRSGQTLTLERVKSTEEGKPDTWKRLSPSAGDPDRSRVENLLAGLADIRATSFQTSTARTGIDSPALVVVAKFEDGKKEERVSFGQSGSDAFARRTDDPGVARIEADKLKEAIKTFDELSK